MEIKDNISGFKQQFFSQRINGWILFCVLCLLIAFQAWLNNTFLFTRDIYYNTYGEEVALDRIDRFLDIRERLTWMIYAVIPFVLLVKVSFVVLCINTGLLTRDDEENKIGFKKLFKIVLLAELIFIAANYIRTLWLVCIKHIGDLKEIQKFYPLSLDFLTKYISDWFVYPLLTANLFEVAYVLFIAYCLHLALGQEYKRTLLITALSYGIGLLLWCVVVVFLSINLS
jgi:hypothetical protein